MQAQAMYHGQAPDPSSQLAPQIVAITPPPSTGAPAAPAPPAAAASQQPPPPPPPAPASPMPPTPAPACATATPRPVQMGTAHVLLPGGAQAGQQIQFVPPGGRQPMYFVAPAAVPPQGTVAVQYPTPQLPPPVVSSSSVVDEDRRTANQQWVVYALGFPLCCVSPLLAVCLWGVLATVYYLNPAQVRGQRPMQRGPARAAAATATATCACAFFAMSGVLAVAAACGGDLEHCKFKWQPGTFYHVPVAPLAGKVNITLSGAGCANGFGRDLNQKYIYQGEKKEHRAYYRGETNKDIYIYYAQYNPKEVGGWFVGRWSELKPKEPPQKAAYIRSSDFSLPVGPQQWDFVWCGDHAEKDRVITADVQMGRHSMVWSTAAPEPLPVAGQAIALKGEPIKLVGKPLSGKADIKLSGAGCANGYGREVNQKYIYKGEKPDHRAYYQGETNKDMYIYYAQYNPKETGAWFVGRWSELKPKEPPQKFAYIRSSDLSFPVGPQKWDFVWCGDHEETDRMITAEPQANTDSIAAKGLAKKFSAKNAKEFVAKMAEKKMAMKKLFGAKKYGNADTMIM